MARHLSLARIQLKEQARVLRKMGWTQQRIADNIGVPRRTIRDWFGGNDTHRITAKRYKKGDNLKARIPAKPTFLSWCGQIENFQPEDNILFDLIIADPPWNISTNAKHGLPVDNEVRDQIIVELKQGKDGYDPMGEEEIAREMGISQQRVSQVIASLLGASIFAKDKAKVREAIRLYSTGMSQAKVGERFGVTQPTISSVIRDYMKRKDLIAQHLRNRGHLKSVVQYPQRGPWGDIKFRGNTSGYLLVDLIDYYQPKSILDQLDYRERQLELF